MGENHAILPNEKLLYINGAIFAYFFRVQTSEPGINKSNLDQFPAGVSKTLPSSISPFLPNWKRKRCSHSPNSPAQLDLEKQQNMY